MPSPIPPPFLEHTIQGHGVSLHVMEFGDPAGPVLLFLHGFPEFWYGWRHQIPFFVQQGYRVIVPDQRGYNRSEKPAGLRAYRVEELVEDLVALIHSLTTEPISIVGHDWGGIVLWSLLGSHPALVRRAVILNAPRLTSRGSSFKIPFQRLIRQFFKSWYIGFFQLPWLPEWVFSRGMFRLVSRMMQNTSLPGTFSDEDRRHYEAAWTQPGSFRAMINWYRALRFGPARTAVTIQVPVLLLWGVKDAFLEADLGPRSLQYCPNGRLLRVESATHWLHHERIEFVNQAIHDFLFS